MKLTVIDSSSAGNCYVLHNDTEALIIESGVKFSEVKKALNFNISKIKAVLVTHEHGDHAKYAKEYATAGYPLVASAGTLAAIGLKIKPSEEGKVYVNGGFRIMPFNTIHDCSQPFGFVIWHAETGNILFATDTADIPYRFGNLNNILIEANYDDDIVNERMCSGNLNAKHQERVEQSHMSIATCEQFLLENDISNVNNIVLIHLSDGNSNAQMFKQRIERKTGENVHVADAGLTIDFNKEF